MSKGESGCVPVRPGWAQFNTIYARADVSVPVSDTKVPALYCTVHARTGGRGLKVYILYIR